MAAISEITKELKFSLGYRKRLMAAQKALNARAPKAGDLAPDFTLYDIEGKDSVTLADFLGEQPVVLVFGSFT